MANYITEAFKKLDCLDEDLFEVSKEGTEELKDFIDEDYINEVDQVIDVDADDEEEIKDSYVGKVILNCPVCHTMHYEDKERIEYDEGSDLVDISKECPYCHDVGGFEVIGEVAPYADIEVKVDDETVTDDGKEEEKEEEEVKIDEDWSVFKYSSGANPYIAKTEKEVERICRKYGDKVEKISDTKYIIHDDLDESCKKKLKEAPIYGLNTQFDSRKSFGGKAQVDIQGDKETLYSYDTPVVVIEKGEVTLLPKWDLSATTLRHVKEFLKQHGFKAETRNQIAADYIQNMEESVGKSVTRDALKKVVGKKPVKEGFGLPKDVRIDAETMSDLGIVPSETDGDEEEEIISDYLSDEYGFCHFGFEFEDEGDHINVYNIKWDNSESCKSRKKVKEDKTSKIDRIDAKRDNRVEKAKADFEKTLDDADADRDDEKKEIKVGLKEDKQSDIVSKEEARKIFDKGDEVYISNGGRDYWGYDNSDGETFDDIIKNYYNNKKNLSFMVDHRPLTKDHLLDRIKERRKVVKEDLSYGEVSAITDEWEKFKKKTGRSDADAAHEFIETECKGIYNTDEEKEDIFALISSVEESLKSSLKESDKPASLSMKDAQKWVDYDMKKYGRISNKTNSLVKKAGFQIIKDQYGDYEVAAGHFESIQDSHKQMQEPCGKSIKKDFKNGHCSKLEEKLNLVTKSSSSQLNSGAKSLYDSLQKDNIDVGVYTGDDGNLSKAGEILVFFEDESKRRIIKDKALNAFKEIGWNPTAIRDEKTDRSSFIGFGDIEVSKSEPIKESTTDIIDATQRVLDKKENATQREFDKAKEQQRKGSYKLGKETNKNNELKKKRDELLKRFGAKDMGELRKIMADADIELPESLQDPKLTEAFEKVELETATEKIRVESESKEAQAEDETIVPLTDDTITEIENKDEMIDNSFDSIDEIGEEDIDELGEGYLKKVYENVNSFKTNNCKIENGKLVVEGVIGFKSGKEKKTSFVFESVNTTKTGKVKIIGENKSISKCKDAFTFTGKVDNKKFIAESLTYKYNAKTDADSNAKRIYGRVTKKK